MNEWTLVAVGRTACPGYVRGRAKLITNAISQESDFVRGNILFVRNAGTEHTTLMFKAAGMVSELGGITCHMATVARELNTPAIVAANGILDKIKDGADVVVDASESVGKIYILNNQNNHDNY
jgi:pyruvate,water dikinase